MKKNLRNYLAGAVVAASVFVLSSAGVFAATTKVTVGECRVRTSASTSSEVAFTAKRGAELEVLSATDPGDGYTWYEVKDGADHGFIRSDLVEKPAGFEANNDPAGGTSEGSAGDESSPSSGVGSSQALAGVVSADTVTVRSGASTSTSKAGSAKGGQEVSITGEAMDADGYTWYQISFIANDKAVEGFIRADFLEITQFAEPEEEVEEEPAPVIEKPEPKVNNDYEVIYEENSDGEMEWFLYDHIKGTKQAISNIYAVMDQSQQYSGADSGKVKTMRIIIIIMGVAILIFIIAVIILSLKLKDTYEDYPDDEGGYQDDDDDSYEEEEEEDDDNDDDDEDDYKPKRRLGFGGKNKRRGRKSSFDFDDDDDDDDDDDEEEEYVRPTRRSRRAEETSNAWSTNGMLDIDDDMEFEFLDFDK